MTTQMMTFNTHRIKAALRELLPCSKSSGLHTKHAFRQLMVKVLSSLPGRHESDGICAARMLCWPRRAFIVSQQQAPPAVTNACRLQEHWPSCALGMRFQIHALCLFVRTRTAITWPGSPDKCHALRRVWMRKRLGPMPPTPNVMSPSDVGPACRSMQLKPAASRSQAWTAWDVCAWAQR